MSSAARIVSLVPSLTDAVAALGAAERLVGVTDYCVHGAPAQAARIGGTKNPDLEAVCGLSPDLVLANTEENRAADLAALRQRDVAVWESFPRRVDDIPGLLRELGGLVGAPEAGEQAAAAVVRARDAARSRRPAMPLATLTLCWRKPWRGIGADTYASDLLVTCGFANVLAGDQDRYPRLEPGLHLGPEVVLLPSEPYAFDAGDLPAVRELVGDECACELVDGELLTWHGPRTAAALEAFTALAGRLDAALRHHRAG